MAKVLNIFSFNTRGLGNKIKRQTVFEWLTEKSEGIYLLQETHSDSACEKVSKNSWRGTIALSHGKSNCRGVITLFLSYVQPVIENGITDNEGRFLLLDCLIDDIRYILVYLYAPTFDRKAEKMKF